MPQKSYIEDVPFQLNSFVEPALNYGDSNIDIGDLGSKLNSNVYDYDFKRENKVLQESYSNEPNE